MSLLGPIDPGAGYLKASIFGEAGAGKTTTATKLAIGTRRHFNLPGPIVFIDTENGSPFVSKWIEQETGKPLIGVKTRSFDDLKAATAEAMTIGASVVIVDSISHFWDELGTTFLKRVNDSRRANRLQTLAKLEFNHLNELKTMWATWTALFLNSPVHIVTCGRLQNKWSFEEDERGRKQLIKSGIRMRAEREFGHEASILVSMSSEQEMDGNDVLRVIHRAFIEKDRNTDPKTSICGKTFDDPDFKDFLPHLETLVPSKHAPVDTSRETKIEVDEAGNADWNREKRDREVMCEEIAAALDMAGIGGTGNEAKTLRPKLLEECFGTASKTKLENTRADVLREGLAKLRIRLGEIKEKA